MSPARSRPTAARPKAEIASAAKGAAGRRRRQAAAGGRHPAPDAKAKKVAGFRGQAEPAASPCPEEEADDPGRLYEGAADHRQQLEPILQTIMQQRGANMILDKTAVVFASPQAVAAFDITQAAIEQLNQKLPSLKVDLVAPPPLPGCCHPRRRIGIPSPRGQTRWPILASTTIAALSVWPRFAARKRGACRRQRMAQRWSRISRAWKGRGRTSGFYLGRTRVCSCVRAAGLASAWCPRSWIARQIPPARS